VRGAEIGDTIEVKIRSIELWLPIAAMSFRAGRGSIPEEFPYSRDKLLWIDLDKKTIDFAPGVVIRRNLSGATSGLRRRLRWGALTPVSPASTAATWTITICSGHEFVPSVHARGALLSIADGHAAQGNGEVGQSAIETSLKGEIQVILHKGMKTAGHGRKPRRTIWRSASIPI